MSLALVQVQAQDVKNLSLKVDSLQKQVEKLTYDYHYLDCSSKLERLNLQLSIFINTVKNNVDRLLISAYHNSNFDREYYLAAKLDYETSKDLLDSYKTEANVMKWCIEPESFKESDAKVVELAFNTTDAAIESAEISLEQYKKIIDIIRE